ncbi:formin-F-like [Aphis craccivora]|uniref:Formin-F-like n=1 Tax=Aphis craccivora TaxID=307492 RepID=A0A6G0Y5S1_APHCR|nr:formin-F-like [Aphis craccivora]
MSQTPHLMVSGSFEVFTQQDNNDDTQHDTNTTNNVDQTNAETHIKSPQPIFVKGVQDFPGLCTSLIEILGVENFICKSSTDLLQKHIERLYTF